MKFHTQHSSMEWCIPVREVGNFLLCNKSLFIYQGNVFNAINHVLEDSIITLKMMTVMTIAYK